MEIDEANVDEVMGGTDDLVSSLVEKAVKMLEGDDGVSETEQARTETNQKKRKLEMVDMFPPSAGRIPNFKKKSDTLKKKKLSGAGPSKTKDVGEEYRKKKRTKSFLVG